MNNIFKHIKLSIFTAFILFSSSCSKDKDEFGSEDGETTVSFTVTGIEDSKSQSPDPIKLASLNTQYSSDGQETVSVSTTYTNEVGFTVDAIAEQTSIGNGISSFDNKTSLRDKIKNRTTRKTAANMTPGHTYRILFYKNNSPTVWKTFDGTVGTPIKFDVSKGDSYQWIAYSYNEDQPLPAIADLQNPTVEAPINKDLLHAQGTLNIPTGTPTGNIKTYNVPILFKHKMTKVTVKVDATKLGMYATVNGIKAHFIDQNNFKSATFDVKQNSFSNLQNVPVSQFLDANAVNPSNTWEFSYYTADPSIMDEFEIKVSHLPVTFKSVDPSKASINLATFTNANYPVVKDIKFLFKYTSPTYGDELIANVGLSYTLPSKRILHVSSGGVWGYAMERNAPWKMLSDLRNFGNLDNSLVRMVPWDAATPSKGVWIGGTATDNTANYVNANTTATILAKLNPTDATLRPDIVIFAFDQLTYTTALQDAIVNYVNAGGIFILMNEYIHPTGVGALLNKLFALPTGTITPRFLSTSGAMYPLLNVNDRVLNGPFGDVRGKYWGEDSSTSVGLLGVPSSEVTIYSYGQAINRADDVTDAITPSMFSHKTKNFFYLGDGGLTAYDGGTSSTACPFEFDATTGRPKAKPYGNAYSPKNYVARSQDAQNSIIAGNLMLWAAELAEFKGIRPWRYNP
ncbi:hypothetical protein [Sphingobacterium bovistauri]|uniref:Fimbrillin family protein n=1 Tax=Sphingobacterium bovistauri TaxID=2781959 RepID=A0ABS7Z2K3_9SPHI|nr:hypothetical protein [Sphingobacterium bovistauri]MCA5004401.1 fimbrillin family protein [Sphingobacterium bovistauri]